MRGSARVRGMLDAGGIHLAYTTVMTTLDRVYKKQLLNRSAEGRAYRYSPRYTQEELEKAAVGESVRQLLGSGEAAALPLSYWSKRSANMMLVCWMICSACWMRSVASVGANSGVGRTVDVCSAVRR